MDYKALLSEKELQRITEQRSKFLAKYYAMWHEYGHLNKFMITLSPINNSLNDTLIMKRAFMKLYNNKLTNSSTPRESHYFSSIEIGLNKNSGLDFVELHEQSNLNMYQTNYHWHLQLLTNDLSKQELQKMIDSVDHQTLSFHKHLSVSWDDSAEFIYIMKNLDNVDYQLQYLIRRNHPSEQLYSSSKGKYPDFVITKVYHHLKQTYRTQWNQIQKKDRYKFISDGFKKKDIVIDKKKLNKKKKYNIITIPLYKSKTIREVYILDNIL